MPPTPAHDSYANLRRRPGGPPAAAKPSTHTPSFTGKLPMPTGTILNAAGQPVSAISSLDPKITQAAAEARASTRPENLPIPAQVQPLVPKTVRFDELSPAEQARIGSGVTSAVQLQKAGEPLTRRGETTAWIDDLKSTFSTQKTVNVITPARDENPWETVQTVTQSAIEEPRVAEKYVENWSDPVDVPEASEPAPELEPEPTTGAGDSGPGICSHCGWPQDQLDSTEPERGDVVAYINAMIGGLAYTRTTPLMGGNLTLTFRVLASGEVDAVFTQVDKESRAGLLATVEDQFERVARLRFVLQLAEVRTSGGLVHTLPEGLSRETNPNAKTVWKVEFPDAEKYIATKVLPTETIYRMAADGCKRFNRHVAKLEAMAETPDFWSATGGTG